MGIWALPDTKEKSDKLKEAAKKIEQIQNDIWDVYGDDILMDYLCESIEMINNAAKEWKKNKEGQ